MTADSADSTDGALCRGGTDGQRLTRRVNPSFHKSPWLSVISAKPAVSTALLRVKAPGMAAESKPLEKLFRAKVINLLVQQKLLPPERA